jgi:transposase
MTMSRVEVITSVQRRRRWSREEKERLVAACFEPGVSVSHVARRAGIHSSQLFRWRRELCRRTDTGVPQLVPVQIAPALSPASPCKQTGIIEIDLGVGRYVRVDRDVDTEALRRVLDVLERR